MLFFSFFKTLIDTPVTVELKNDISLRGTLKSVDQYLNIKLDDVTVAGSDNDGNSNEVKYPHLSSVKNVFIRGSVVRYVHLVGESVDTALLEDAARRGEFQGLLTHFLASQILIGPLRFSRSCASVCGEGETDLISIAIYTGKLSVTDYS